MFGPTIAVAFAAALPPTIQDGAQAPASAAGERTSHLGVPAGTLDGLVRPLGVAFGPDGSLWVAEGGDLRRSARVVGFSSDSLALEEGASSAPAPARTLGAGVLVEPVAVAASAGAGAVFVADRGAHRVLAFDADGEAHEVIAARGAGAGEVVFPSAVALAAEVGDAGTLLVGDAYGAQTCDLATGHWTRLPLAGVVRVDAIAALAGAPLRMVVADGARQTIEVFGADGTRLARLSEWGAFPGQVSSPGGIAVADGLAFVADTENHRVQAFDPDADDPLAYRFGVHAIEPGEGDGALHYPADVAIRADGALLALPEPLDDRVQLFGRGEGPEPARDPLRKGIGQAGAHLGPPAAAAGQYLVTVSPESHRIQAHDLRLGPPVRVSEFGGFGARFGAFRGPAGVALADGGRALAVTDSGSRRLTRARLDVRPDAPIGQDPELVTYLDGLLLDRLAPDGDAVPILPGAVAFLDAAGERLAVADRANGRVLFLGADLELTAESPAALGDVRGLVANGAGGVFAAVAAGSAGAPGRVLEIDADGAVARELGADVLARPEGLALAGDRLFVSDPARHRVEAFDLAQDGALAFGFGARGLGAAEFNGPRGLAIVRVGEDATPRLVVIDHGNHRGQIFDLDGNLIEGFGSRLYVNALEGR